MYIDYEYYIENGGDIDMEYTAFSRAGFRARKIVDRLTQSRIQRMSCPSEAVMQLMVELVTLESTQGAAVQNNQALTSFTNDGYSETYAAPLTSERVKEIESELVLEYLSGETDDNGTPLLWLGVD